MKIKEQEASSKYEIVERVTMPSVRMGRASKWKRLFESLPMNKAIKFSIKDAVRANSMTTSISCTLRRHGIIVSTRRVRTGEGYDLYVWKREKVQSNDNQ